MELTSSLRALYAPGVAYEIATPDRTIPDMVAEVAARYPSRAAIDFFARPLTYSQLVADMRRCAGALRQAGVRPGDRVALVIPNCPQHAVAVLGTMLLGAIVVEHNPLAPAEELRGEYGRHGARVTIAWSKSLDKLTFLGRGHTTFALDLTTALPAASRWALRLPLKAPARSATCSRARTRGGCVPGPAPCARPPRGRVLAPPPSATSRSSSTREERPACLRPPHSRMRI